MPIIQEIARKAGKYKTNASINASKCEEVIRNILVDIRTRLVLRLSGCQGDILPIPTLLHLPYATAEDF